MDCWVSTCENIFSKFGNLLVLCNLSNLRRRQGGSSVGAIGNYTCDVEVQGQNTVENFLLTRAKRLRFLSNELPVVFCVNCLK